MATALPRVDDPASLGLLLAGVYAVASLAQLVVGKLIDRIGAIYRQLDQHVLEH